MWYHFTVIKLNPILGIWKYYYVAQVWVSFYIPITYSLLSQTQMQHQVEVPFCQPNSIQIPEVNFGSSNENFIIIHLELRALVQLIGPYGVKHMTEKLTWHVACQITELYKIIRDNRETLHAARVNFDKPEKLREVLYC